jgi:hypothetical protein
MMTRSFGPESPDFPEIYPRGNWMGHSGKASWYATEPQYYQGAFPPAGALYSGGAQMLKPPKPNLMMDPSDPTTWRRDYRFTR